MQTIADICPRCRNAVVRGLTDSGASVRLEPETIIGGAYAPIDIYRAEPPRLRVIFRYSDERGTTAGHEIHRCPTERTEAVKLFEPAPAQIPGQLAL